METTGVALGWRNADLNDLLCEEAINNPAAYYAKLRKINPVYWNPKWNGWIVTGYDAVATAHKLDGRCLSSDRFSGPFAQEIKDAGDRYAHLLNFLSKLFIFKDPPDHTRVRRLLGKALTPRSVEGLRARVRGLVSELTNSMRRRDSIDFLADFAYSLPLIVMAEFIGVPSDARHVLHQWSTDIMGVTANRGSDVNRIQRGEAAMERLVDFLRPIIRDRKSRPKNDLLTRMASAEESREFLSEEEVIANAVLMVIAGHETTINLLANGVVAFSRFSDQWERLRRAPELAQTAVEEILRYDGPVRAIARWAKAPFELCGQRIVVGDRVLLVEYAANRDPAVFMNPDTFDIGRHPNRHLGFGQGIHACAGAALARLEGQETFSHLALMYDSIEILDDALTYDGTVVARSLTKLNVAFHEPTR